MIEWITDRLPTKADADFLGFVRIPSKTWPDSPPDSLLHDNQRYSWVAPGEPWWSPKVPVPELAKPKFLVPELAKKETKVPVIARDKKCNSLMAKRSDLSKLTSYFVGLLIVTSMLFGCYWIAAIHKAEAFNRLTNGPKVTTWDAFWLDLRVEAQR